MHRPIVLRPAVHVPRPVELADLLLAGNGVGDEVGPFREEADQSAVPRVVDRALDGLGRVRLAGRIGRVGRLGHIQTTELQQPVVGIDVGGGFASQRVGGEGRQRQEKHREFHNVCPCLEMSPKYLIAEPWPERTQPDERI